VQLPLADLEGATQGFSDFNEIGGGASCTVYSGTLWGVAVAVKRLKDSAVAWEAKQYESETALLRLGVLVGWLCTLFARN
jgi:hypothetical protein